MATQTFQLPESVTNARQNAENLTGAAQQYAAAEPTVSEILRQKVQEAYAQNQDIIGPLNQATSTYLSAPSVAREKYLTPGSANYVANPFAAERLVSESANQAAVPMLSYGSILGQRQGSIADQIRAGVGGYQAAAQTALAKAQNARTMYEDSLNEYLQLQQLGLRQQEIDKPSGSGGNNITISGITVPGMGGTTTGGGVVNPNEVSLVGPDGVTYYYDGPSDPDYIADSNAWRGGGGNPAPQGQSTPSTVGGNPLDKYFNNPWNKQAAQAPRLF